MMIKNKSVVLGIIILLIGMIIIPSTGNLLSDRDLTINKSKDISFEQNKAIINLNKINNKDETIELSPVENIKDINDKRVNPVIIVIVNSTLMTSITNDITIYVSTLKNIGYDTIVLVFSGGTVEELKDQILTYWNNGYNITGLVMIGNLPAAWYYHAHDFDGKRARFPCDLFLMDLDGEWIDSDGDGEYDSHIDGAGDTAPEIYVGRIDASNIPGDEITILKKYFQKVRDFWNGNISRTFHGLTYVGSDWVGVEDMRSSIGICYDSYEAMWWPDFSSRDYLANRLSNSEYEFIQLSCHSGPTDHRFGVGGLGDQIFSDDVRSAPPRALFYNLYACYALKFTTYNCLGNAYIMNTNTSSLTVVGMTKSGGVKNYSDFYTPLSMSCSLGKALQLWFEDQYPYSDWPEQPNGGDVSWFYGMTILGDPTLTPMNNRNIGVQSLDISDNHIKYNDSITVNATLFNSGRYNETDVTVSLRLNDVEIENMAIPDFSRRTNEQVSFDLVWTYHTPGKYKLTIHVATKDSVDDLYLDDEKSQDIIAGVYNINSGECFNTIQEAIDDRDTQSGHTILVPSGTYNENIKIYKDISLMGDSRDTTIIKGAKATLLSPTISISNANSVTIKEFMITYGAKGVFVDSSSNINIVHNIISNNKAPQNYPFNGAGIYLSSSDNVDIIDNNITENDIGLVVKSGSTNNIFYHNNFINAKNVFVDEDCLSNIWDDGYPSSGNFWSDYCGDDKNYGPNQDIPGSDGIGDYPYLVFKDMKDNYPLMSPWSGISLVPKPHIVYVDDDFNASTYYWGYNHFDSIYDGIEAVEDDGTVYVYNSYFMVNLIIDKPISVIGDKNTIIDGDGNGPVVNILADHVNFDGFVVKGDTEIQSSYEGINISANHTIIIDNKIINCSKGILLNENANYSIIKENIITNNKDGIYLKKSSNNILTKNIISDNDDNGMYLVGSSNNNIICNNNFIENMDYGVYLKYNPPVPGHGESNPRNNSIYHNNFINNTRQAYNKRLGNYWNKDYPSGGNYWSDFDEANEGAYDNNSDGIVDDSYTLYGVTDNYPFMNQDGWLDPIRDLEIEKDR